MDEWSLPNHIETVQLKVTIKVHRRLLEVFQTMHDNFGLALPITELNKRLERVVGVLEARDAGIDSPPKPAVGVLELADEPDDLLWVAWALVHRPLNEESSVDLVEVVGRIHGRLRESSRLPLASPYSLGDACEAV